MDKESLVIVSGLPRSGTSMMMKMLAAGGIEPMTDNIRTADEDNPKGYFELERVKQLESDKEWLPEARGKVVKLISALLKHLPNNYAYKVVFMQRRMPEILASQRQMLIRRGEPADSIPDEKMAAMFERHLAQVENWLSAQPNIRTIYVSYNETLTQPAKQIAKISDFLGSGLDVEAMATVVDQTLHRQRSE